MAYNFSNDEFVDPVKVLRELPLKENMIACDLGCGSGGWAVPLSYILQNGMIYAVDILEENISVLKGRIVREEISNISPMLADIERGVDIEDKHVDFVLLTNILFQIENKENLIKECRRILKSRGLLLIIDYKKDAAFGPAEGRFSIEEISPILERLGFRTEKQFEAGKYHWAMILSK
ncbi:MAG: class I SAM-dependent methyltransferase [Candidatus Paceibacterota bacterium]